MRTCKPDNNTKEGNKKEEKIEKDVEMTDGKKLLAQELMVYRSMRFDCNVTFKSLVSPIQPLFFFFSLNSYKSLDLCLTIRYFLRVLPLSSVSLSVSRSFFLVKLRCYRSSGNGFDYTRAFHASGGQSSRWNVGDGATIRPPPNFQVEFYPVCSSISRMVVWCKIIDSKKIFFSLSFLDLLFEIRQGRPRNRP